MILRKGTAVDVISISERHLRKPHGVNLTPEGGISNFRGPTLIISDAGLNIRSNRVYVFLFEAREILERSAEAE